MSKKTKEVVIAALFSGFVGYFIGGMTWFAAIVFALFGAVGAMLC